MSAAGCDVLVTGGGVAGTAAAVAAARAGCRTLLIERCARLGGIGTRGMLRTICGLYGTGPDLPKETLNAGISREIASRLQQRAPQRRVTKAGRLFVLPYDSDELATDLHDLCRQEQLLGVRFGVEVISTIVTNGKVAGVVTRNGGAEERISPYAVIDCTGSGEVAVQAGAAYDLASPEDRQLGGYTVRVLGIGTQDEALAVKVPYALAHSPLKYTTFAYGDAAGEGFLKFSIEAGGREAEGEVDAAFKVLTERLPAFRNAVIEKRSGMLEREGRRIRGEYELTADDVLSARKFPDSVVKNAWPIELWDKSKGTSYQYVPESDYYEMPLRCLVVKGFTNLLVAGRCISVSHEALGSTRVMGACMAMGDAAGRAAAGLVKNGKYS